MTLVKIGVSTNRMKHYTPMTHGLKGSGVPQPCSVEIRRDVSFRGSRTDALDILLRKDDAACAVVGVLDLDGSRWGLRRTGRRPQAPRPWPPASPRRVG